MLNFVQWTGFKRKMHKFCLSFMLPVWTNVKFTQHIFRIGTPVPSLFEMLLVFSKIHHVGRQIHRDLTFTFFYEFWGRIHLTNDTEAECVTLDMPIMLILIFSLLMG
jgi:hypothetical protein